MTCEDTVQPVPLASLDLPSSVPPYPYPLALVLVVVPPLPSDVLLDIALVLVRESLVGGLALVP